MTTCTLHPSWHSLWSRNMVSNSTTRPIEEHRHIWSVVSVLHVYCEFPDRTAFQMKRSADIPTNHHSYTSSVPVVLNSSTKLCMLICLWTTDQPSGPVWPLCQETGTTDQADLIKLGSHSWMWWRYSQHWSDNCLSSSTKSIGTEGACGNDDIDWTSHMMTMMMMW